MAGIPEPLARLRHTIEDMGFVITIDEPLDPDGEWWMDIFVKDRTDCIDEVVFRNGGGFGFFDDDAGFGSKPGTLVATVQQAFAFLNERLAVRLAQ